MQTHTRVCSPASPDPQRSASRYVARSERRLNAKVSSELFFAGSMPASGFIAGALQVGENFGARQIFGGIQVSHRTSAAHTFDDQLFRDRE